MWEFLGETLHLGKTLKQESPSLADGSTVSDLAIRDEYKHILQNNL